MRKIIVLLSLLLLLTGCNAEYNLELSNNTYKESLYSFGNKDELIDNVSFEEMVKDYYNKNIIVQYDAQPGDIMEEEYPLYYDVYDKMKIDDNRFGLLLKHSYVNIDDFKKSKIINELFYNISIKDNFIKLSDTKNIFDMYQFLDKITISFKTDKYIKSINADDKKDDCYYWYIDRSNYNGKSIYILFTNNKLESIKSLSKEQSNRFVDITVLLIVAILLLVVVIIYERIKISNK